MWTKLDDNFPDHPKVVEAGPLASWLYVCGLCYSNRYLTDGFIPSGQVRRLADLPDPRECAAVLVRVGLWHEIDGGYQIHDFHDCNMTAEEAKRKREQISKARSEAGARGAEARWQTDSNLPSGLPQGLMANADGKTMAPNPNPNLIPLPEPKPKGERQAKALARPLPDDFVVTDEMKMWAKRTVPGLNVAAATEQWMDAMRSNTTKYKYTDWAAAWRNGMKHALQWGVGGTNGTNRQDPATIRPQTITGPDRTGLREALEEHRRASTVA
jgi:hypothetical protein